MHMMKSKNAISILGIRDDHLQPLVFIGLVVTSISLYKCLYNYGFIRTGHYYCFPAMIDNNLAHSHPLPFLNFIQLSYYFQFLYWIPFYWKPLFPLGETLHSTACLPAVRGRCRNPHSPGHVLHQEHGCRKPVQETYGSTPATSPMLTTSHLMTGVEESVALSPMVQNPDGQHLALETDLPVHLGSLPLSSNET